ncbi:MAG: RNA-directed DNA polymerase [Muribaculaceae bacterium]|nr:RNA-directed DNA polymerase [Muribaculaceae bacterium]
MNIYSAENIEYIVKRGLGKEGKSSILPEPFKSLHENLKSLKNSKKEYAKQFKRLKMDFNSLKDDVILDAGINATQETDLSVKIDDLDAKIKETSIKIEECETNWNKAIEKYAKDLLKDIRTKKLNAKIDDFLLFDKTTFKTGDFPSKVVEQLIKDDIAKHYKRKPSDRNIIVEQLKRLLDNKLPKCIIRADIKSFFESVPMDKLLKRLENDGYVSTLTMYYLKKISQDVKAKGVDGLPRGLAFSSYLTEIYLQKADDEIRNLPNLYFYQRYVDDIVMLFSMDKKVPPKLRLNEGWKHWKCIKEIFKDEDLTLHEDGKKKCVIYSGETTKKEFDYLGYKFKINQGKLIIKLSDNRLNGYVNKIVAVINHYNETARDNESLPDEPKEDVGRRRKRQQPLKRLFGQLSALTGNGMLKGPKSNILTGIYYSNVHITCIDDFKTLDNLLEDYITSHLDVPENLFKYDDACSPEDTVLKIKEMMIQKWSFVDGFKNRRFCKNSSYFNRLKQIKNLSQ